MLFGSKANITPHIDFIQQNRYK